MLLRNDTKPHFSQYSANRPYKGKLDRKLPVDREAGLTYRQAKLSPTRSETMTDAKSSPRLEKPHLIAQTRLQTSPFPLHPQGIRQEDALGPRAHSPGAPGFLVFPDEPEAYTNASPWTPGGPPDVSAPSAPDAMRDWSKQAKGHLGSQWLQATPSS